MPTDGAVHERQGERCYVLRNPGVRAPEEEMGDPFRVAGGIGDSNGTGIMEGEKRELRQAQAVDDRLQVD